MAKDIFRTPLDEVRWAHLITPRHQLDKSKPKAWTADLLLPNGDEKAQAFLLAMEDQFIALHGSRKRRAEKGFPWKADKEKPSEITVVRFKVPQFQRRDVYLRIGSTAAQECRATCIDALAQLVAAALGIAAQQQDPTRLAGAVQHQGRTGCAVEITAFQRRGDDAATVLIDAATVAVQLEISGDRQHCAVCGRNAAEVEIPGAETNAGHGGCPLSGKRASVK